jgi:hypothetical protein
MGFLDNRLKSVRGISNEIAPVQRRGLWAAVDGPLPTECEQRGWGLFSD